jgi:hypothetical protein
MRFLRYALQQTSSALGGRSFFLFFLPVPAVGFGLHLWLDGSSAVEVEVRSWLIYGLAATLIIAVAVFLAFLVSAPYRMEREDHDATKKELAKLRSILPQSSEARTLSKEQKSILADGIRSVRVRPEQFNVLFSSFSEECADFAADIGEALAAAGLNCSVHDGAMFESDARDRGLKLIHGKSAVLRDYAEKVQGIMKDAGYFAERRELDGNDESIFFYVARKE